MFNDSKKQHSNYNNNCLNNQITKFSDKWLSIFTKY